MAGLREMWGDVIPQAGDLADELVRRYAGKRIAYRDRYLIVVLEALDSLEQLATDPVAVRLAAWFHQAAHSANHTAIDDAATSAQLAEKLLPKYGVNEVRTAEVARLVWFSGGEGANGAVLQDAVNAVLADPQYATFASEIRRDSRFDIGVRREQLRAMLASERIYRTDLAHERYEQAARANLATELELLDGMARSRWHGWQHSALTMLAIIIGGAAIAGLGGAMGSPWRYPKFDDDPRWQPILMAVLALASLVAATWAVRRTDRTARIVATAPAVLGLVAAVVVLANIPPSTGSSGPGPRVPMMMLASVALILSGAAAFVATWFPQGVSKNRGRLLGIVAVCVVVILLGTLFDRVQNAYLLGANEYVDNRHVAADTTVRSVVDGGTLWSSPGGGYDLWSVVGTAHGIAIARGRAAVELIDPRTGKTRWRYVRSDTDDPPKLYSLNGGQQLLVSFERVGFLVLDAETGKRVTAWPDGAVDDEIDDNDPLITMQSRSVDTDKVYGTNTDGSHRWTYEPGRCTSTAAAATAETVVLGVGVSCMQVPGRLIGLDLKTGKKLWSHDGGLTDLTVVGNLVIGRSDETMTAVDARSGEVRWTTDLPKDRGCPLRLAAAGENVVLVGCPSGGTRDTHNVVRFIDPANGRVLSTADVLAPGRSRFAVTTDGRVFMLSGEGPTNCRIAKVVEGAAVAYVPVDPAVGCGWGVVAAGNVVLVSTRESLIALR
ncbi:MAG: PQQ-binding-like beta-propeller repeat protein [Kribbellaceae bacterium]|nr:PQQ-binding-like beta-propeller repeat protein [Kribbellaceae bacterium]